MPPALVFNGPVVDVTDTIEEALPPNRARMPADLAPTPSADASTGTLVFMTREGCANTAVMRGNVGAALKSLGLASGYEVVDRPRQRSKNGSPRTAGS